MDRFSQDLVTGAVLGSALKAGSKNHHKDDVALTPPKPCWYQKLWQAIRSRMRPRR